VVAGIGIAVAGWRLLRRRCSASLAATSRVG